MGLDSHLSPENHPVEELFDEDGSITYGSYDEGSFYGDNRSLGDESETLNDDLQRSANFMDTQPFVENISSDQLSQGADASAFESNDENRSAGNSVERIAQGSERLSTEINSHSDSDSGPTDKF